MSDTGPRPNGWRRLGRGLGLTVFMGVAVYTLVFVLPGLATRLLGTDVTQAPAPAPSAILPTGEVSPNDLAPLAQQYRPTSAVIRTAPFGPSAKTTDVWFSSTRSDTVLCWSWSGNPSPGGGCGTENGDPPTGGFQPVFVRGGEKELGMGFADERAKSVAAVLQDGREHPGILVNGKGFPHPVWQVGASSPGSIVSVRFKDANGEVIGELAP